MKKKDKYKVKRTRAAGALNRQIIYGYGSTPPRLQRILEVAQRRTS